MLGHQGDVPYVQKEVKEHYKNNHALKFLLDQQQIPKLENFFTSELLTATTEDFKSGA